MPTLPESAELWCLINAPIGMVVFSLFNCGLLIRTYGLFKTMPAKPAKVKEGLVNIKNKKERRTVWALMAVVSIAAVLSFLFYLGTYQAVEKIGSCEDIVPIKAIEDWRSLYWMILFGLTALIAFISLELKHKKLLN